MSITGETCATAHPERAAEGLKDYRTAADGLRRCLALADLHAERGDARTAAGYLLAAMEDLAPELTTLRALVSD
jgi:hypothetical protein